MTNKHVSAEPFKFTITDNFNSRKDFKLFGDHCLVDINPSSYYPCYI
jgi:hypothetical protein